MSKPWCVMPFNQMSLKESGRYAICCEAKESSFSVKDMTPKEFFYSDYMESVRDYFAFGSPNEDLKNHVYHQSKDMVSYTNKNGLVENSEISNVCQKCIQLEKAGAVSKRIRENNAADLNTVFANYMNDTFLLDFIKFSSVSNKCNLKCVMCGPTSSSLIQKELEENILTGYGKKDWHSIFSDKRKPVSYRDVDDKERWLSDFKEILVNTKEIQFSGGEPTIIPEVYNICEWIQADPDLQHMKIHMNTNGMTAHYKIKPLLEKGQKVELSISVDALGEKDEFIRFNTKWKTVERNINEYIKLREEYPNFRFMIQPTLQLLNIGYIHHLVDYFVEKDVPIHATNTVFHPPHFNPTIIPNELKSFYLDKIYSESKNLDKLDVVIKALSSEAEDLQTLKFAFSSLSLFDTTRHTYWRNMWPELAEYELRMS